MAKVWGIVVMLVGAAIARSDSLIPALSPEQALQARKALAEFKSNPKGPYLRIRWFCNDGTVHPPSPPPCALRGGGHQYAELSPAALRLAQWNIDAGAILASLSFDKFLDAERDHHRLKQLVLEKYLVEVDQGWIYRKARYYRGARQAEDEEKVGRKLLAQLLSDPAWVGRNYLLVNQVVAAVPHGAADSMVQKIRALAKSIADQDARFQALRVKIHSLPGPEDLQAVEKFLAERNPGETVRAQLIELQKLMEQQRSGRELAARLPAYEKKLAGSRLQTPLSELSLALRKRDAGVVFSAGAALTFAIRQQVMSSSDGRGNLDLLDLNGLLLEKGFQTEAGRRMEGATRRELLANLLDNIRYAVGAGLLSMRQFEALRAEFEALQKTPEPAAETYYSALRDLARATEWCRATVAKDFGPVARHYQDIEPAAAGLLDHIVRGSVALPLSNRLDVLVPDANSAVGIRHSIFEETAVTGILGLNPGVALGRLGILDPSKDNGSWIDPERIYVIPETLADLKPMAGILTLDSGNTLSHAQLLASNLGIPNATIPSSLLPLLAKHENQNLFFAVTPRRVVVIRELSRLSPGEQKIWAEQPAAKARIDLDIRRLDLSVKRVLSLQVLGAKDSGVTVGPKAANLAQLASYFPERVAPGLVVPFGIYYDHISRPLDGPVPLRQQIAEALAEAERMRKAGATVAEIGKFLYPKLERFRRVIEEMPLLPQFEKELTERMRAAFGPEASYGVFVRSDTNAEDLPDFTGAGLNLTVPNQVGNRDILQAVKRVWASPLTERAYEWRSKVLHSNEHVYPSVLLLRTVPSDKSGVIATANLETGNSEEITVNVSEGVSAVVDGGVAESLLLKPNGEVRLLQQARCPYKKVVLPGGGIDNRPTSGEDHVLAAGEIEQIRRMVAEVKARYPAANSEAGNVLPWDIEFGFEKGSLRLFQIRPLVQFQELATLEALSKLEPGVEAKSAIRLDEGP